MKKAICLVVLSLMMITTAQAQQWRASRSVNGQNDVLTSKVASTEIRYAVSKTQDNTPSWKESFEDWNGTDIFWLPEGWSAKRTEALTDPDEPHTWTVNKQYNIFYPAPVNGDYYAIAYSSEDTAQDEWLYTPERTPQQGEYLTYYVLFQPLFLFDLKYFDQNSMSFSQYVSTADLQLLISVDGGEWTKVNSLFDIYKEESVQDMYDLAHYGSVAVRKFFVDMAPYAGKSVRFAFRYVGIDGDSMFLDDIEMVKPSLTASYNLPSSVMYFGMTPDFQQPSSAVYLPDATPLTWTNTSSLEAENFTWHYADCNDLSVQAETTDKNLVTTYNTFVPGASQTTGLENTASLPTLTAQGVAGLTNSFTHPFGTMQIGGKARVMVNGEWFNTGANYCHPSHGTTVLKTPNGVPFFGVCPQSSALWTQMFGLDPGDEAHVTGFGTHVNEPAKPYTLRGLTIQGEGVLEKTYCLKAVVLKQNLYGSLEVIGEAVVDANNIVSTPVAGSDHNMYTIPFLFADPLNINKEVWIMIEGLDKAASWFAPLQTKTFENEEQDSHAMFTIGYTMGGEQGSGIYYASNLSVEDETGEFVPCYNNFFINMNMAYGDCDDWGHIDIDIPVPPMPDIPYHGNEMYLYDYNTEAMVEYEQHPLCCGFYDEESSDEDITLYVCIGELYEKEGGEFYSDDVNRTYHMRITMPREDIGKERVTIDDNSVKVDYYSILTEGFRMHADTGWLKVTEIAPHVYNVVIEATDLSNLYALCGHYAYEDAWRWRDYNEKRPGPANEWILKLGADINEQHPIKSVVVDNSNAALPVMYFGEVEGLSTVYDITSLPAEQFVRIQMPASLMDGLYKGFSGWANDDLTVTYKGYDYNHSGCLHDDTCFGGNVQMVTFDLDNQYMNVNSTIFTMIHEGRNNLNLHYEGSFCIDNAASGIEEIYGDENEYENANIYNLAGQRVGKDYRGVIIKNGRKYLK